MDIISWGISCFQMISFPTLTDVSLFERIRNQLLEFSNTQNMFLSVWNLKMVRVLKEELHLYSNSRRNIDKYRTVIYMSFFLSRVFLPHHARNPKKIAPKFSTITNCLFLMTIPSLKSPIWMLYLKVRLMKLFVRT